MTGTELLLTVVAVALWASTAVYHHRLKQRSIPYWKHALLLLPCALLWLAAGLPLLRYKAMTGLAGWLGPNHLVYAGWPSALIVGIFGQLLEDFPKALLVWKILFRMALLLFGLGIAWLLLDMGLSEGVRDYYSTR